MLSWLCLHGRQVNALLGVAHKAVSAVPGTVLVATKTAGAVAAHARVYRTYSEIGIGHITELCGERHPFRSQHSRATPLTGRLSKGAARMESRATWRRLTNGVFSAMLRRVRMWDEHQ